MDRGYSDLKNPSDRLPDLVLPSATSGAGRTVRSSGRRAPVLVLVHGPDCTSCTAYLERLAEGRSEIQDWDGEVEVVSPSPFEERATLDGFVYLHDPDGRLARDLAVSPPAVVIADQWAVIRALEPAGESHEFISVDEVVEWLRFMAIECPECEGEAF